MNIQKIIMLIRFDSFIHPLNRDFSAREQKTANEMSKSIQQILENDDVNSLPRYLHGRSILSLLVLTERMFVCLWNKQM